MSVSCHHNPYINENIQAARETARSGIETVGIAMLPEVAGSFASITHSFGSSQSVLAAWERFMPHVNELEKALQGKSESVQFSF